VNRAQRRAAARGRRSTATPPTIGLAIIARDEQESLPALLDSVAGAFDRVALVDTGSTDATVQVFEDWCRRTRQRHVVDRFNWCFDFAAARNFAQSLLTTSWTCFADADDVVVGAANLRGVAAAAQASPGDRAAVRLRLSRGRAGRANPRARASGARTLGGPHP
jgi:glycosyltransferase involved in cell wall biosynthesis